MKIKHLQFAGAIILALVILAGSLIGRSIAQNSTSSKDDAAQTTDNVKDVLQPEVHSNDAPATAESTPVTTSKPVNQSSPVPKPVSQPTVPTPNQNPCNQTVANQATALYTNQRMTASNEHFARVETIRFTGGISAEERELRLRAEDTRWNSEIADIKYAYNVSLRGAGCPTVN